MASRDFQEEEEMIEDLSNPLVVAFYQEAGKITNGALKLALSLCTEGRSIIEICKAGDEYIEKECAKAFSKRKQLEKGIAFPTAISVNNCVGHFSPLVSHAPVLLKAGDVVKIDLGAHIDGFMVVGAHTTIVGAGASGQPVSGRQADVVCAAHFALECAARMVRPGAKSTAVTEMLTHIASLYNVNTVTGILSHDLKRWVMDGERVIFTKHPGQGHRVEEFEFEENEVYCLDIVMTSGEGKTREVDDRTTIFQRDTSQNYQVKLKASRELLHDINRRFPALPFTLRAFEDEKKTRLGLGELINHKLIHPFPVFYEKDGETVVQFKTTIMILANGNVKLGNLDLPLPFVQSAYSLDEKVQSIVNKPLKEPKKPVASDKMDTN